MLTKKTLLLVLGLCASVSTVEAGSIVSGPNVFGGCTVVGTPVIADTSSPLGMTATYTISLTSTDGTQCAVEWVFERQITPAAGDYISNLGSETDVTNPTGQFLPGVSGSVGIAGPLFGVSGVGGGASVVNADLISHISHGPIQGDVFTLDGSEVTLRQSLVLGWGSSTEAGTTFVYDGIARGFLTPATPPNVVPEPGTWVTIAGAIVGLALIRRRRL